MNRNDLRLTTWRKSLAIVQTCGRWSLCAVLLVLGASQLAGDTAAPATRESRSPTRRFIPAAKPFVKSSQSRAPSPAQPQRDAAVTPASHEEFAAPPPSNYGISPDVVPSQPLPPHPNNGALARPAAPGPSLVFPMQRTVPPQVTGSHLKLQPGETATEFSLRLLADNAGLTEQNAWQTSEIARLTAELKAKDAKLQTGATQINAARKELAQATAEFHRLRKEIGDLREKIRAAEGESASLMRSLSPLLKQILQNEDDPLTNDE